jgi:hypothetical protein
MQPHRPMNRESAREKAVRRAATAQGRMASKSRGFGTWQLAEADGSNPRHFATLEALEQHLGLADRSER